MPGDLKNPEGMFPYHYDPKYEPGTNTFDSQPLNIKDVIQAIAKKVRSRPLSKEELEEAWNHLNTKNLLQMTPGDPAVQEALQDYFTRKKLARKVVEKWLT